jgi:site-specific recombinase XerD
MGHKKLHMKPIKPTTSQFLSTLQDPSGLVNNYLKYMENIKSSSAVTLRTYALDLQQAINREDISRLNNEQLVALFKQAQLRWGNLSPASRNRKGAVIKSFLGFLFEAQFLSADLSHQIHLPRVPRKIPVFLSVDEAIQVFKAPKSATEEILFLLLYGCGLRVSEACSLKTNQFRQGQRTLRVLGKGNKERLVVCPKLLINHLKEIKTEFIFGEAPLHPRTAYEMIRQLGIRAGITKKLHPHALRHSFASHLLTSGANLRVLQELLGHESLQATEKYVHLNLDQLARALNRHHPLGDSK